MPQFDFFSFFVQLFWLTLGNLTFYLIYTRYIAANISRIIKMRAKLKKSSAFLIDKNKEKKYVGYYDLVVRYFFYK